MTDNTSAGPLLDDDVDRIEFWAADGQVSAEDQRALVAEVRRLRAVEAAAKDVLEAHDAADDEMDWTAPAVDMILRRALNEGRHYSSNPQLSDR